MSQLYRIVIFALVPLLAVAIFVLFFEPGQEANLAGGAGATVDEMTFPNSNSYQCDNGKQVTVFFTEYQLRGETIKMDEDQIGYVEEGRAEPVYLTRVLSASGSKFENSEGFGFWMKGDSAIALQNDEIIFRCEKSD